MLLARALKQHPEMERFLTLKAIMPGTSGMRMLSNAETAEPVEYSTLRAIAAGVPRSYPFGSIMLHFHAPVFGERLIGLPKMGNSLPGVWMTDVSWVTGRQRALSVYTVVDAQETDKKLAPNSAAVDAVIKTIGKIRRPERVPIRAPDGSIVGCIPPANVEAVKAVVADYRARFKEVIESADLPHKFPPVADARAENLGVLAGPRKPTLAAAFKPMGYSCRGGTGEFHLTRRTSGNLTVELYIDVGTWSHSVSSFFMVHGAGFKASLGIPVAFGAAAQYPIGDATQWQKIVENLAAMVRELDRTFVREVEKAAGPSPAFMVHG